MLPQLPKATLKPVGHLKVSASGNTFHVNGKPTVGMIDGMSMEDAVQVVREEACVQASKQLFPVRDPDRATENDTDDEEDPNAYVCLFLPRHFSSRDGGIQPHVICTS